MLIAGILLGLLLGLLAGGRLENLAQHPAALARCCSSRRSSSGSGRRRCSTRRRHRRDAAAPAAARRLRPAAGRPVGQPRLPGPEHRLRRHPAQRDRHRRQRRLHADLGTSLAAAGLTPEDVTSALHIVVPGDGRPTSSCAALVLGDIIPIPIPFVRNVASLGDVFLAAGLGVLPVRRASSASRRSSRSTRRPRSMPRLAGLAGSARLPRARRRRGVAAETGLAPRSQRAAGAGAAADASAGRRHGLAVTRAWRPVARRATSRRSTERDGAAPTITLPRPSPEALRARPPPPVRPARPQRLVHGAVGRPADLAVRRPDPPGRAGGGRAGHHGFGARVGPRVRRGDPAEPPLRPDRRHAASIAGTTRRS